MPQKLATPTILLKKYTTGAQLKVVIFKIWSSWIRIRMETQLTVSISRIGTFSIRIFFKSVCSIDLKIVSTAQPISHEAILNLLVVISPMYLVPSQYFQAKIILILDTQFWYFTTKVMLVNLPVVISPMYLVPFQLMHTFRQKSY